VLEITDLVDFQDPTFFFGLHDKKIGMLHILDLAADAAGAAWDGCAHRLAAIYRLSQPERQRAPSDASRSTEKICVAQFPACDVRLKQTNRPLMTDHIPAHQNDSSALGSD
jgi:hypothetical protein